MTSHLTSGSSQTRRLTWLQVGFGVVALVLATVACAQDANLAAIREMLQQPDDRIDLARAKVAIDRMVDPAIDEAAVLAQLDAMAQGIRTKLPSGASNRVTLDALRFFVYQPNPWNNGRPFHYDLDDPNGRNLESKFLSTYLATRKGNCVSMPMLFLILGQKLGLELHAATAPNHVFVKYREDGGQVYNLETTSGAGFTRDVWMRQQFDITDQAIASGIYMRSLTRKQTVLLMAETLMEQYEQQGRLAEVVPLASFALEQEPKDVDALLHLRQAYVTMWRREFADVYRSPSSVPPEKRPRLAELNGKIKTLTDRALAMGWRFPEAASEER